MQKKKVTRHVHNHFCWLKFLSKKCTYFFAASPSSLRTDAEKMMRWVTTYDTIRKWILVHFSNLLEFIIDFFPRQKWIKNEPGNCTKMYDRAKKDKIMRMWNNTCQKETTVARKRTKNFKKVTSKPSRQWQEFASLFVFGPFLSPIFWEICHQSEKSWEKSFLRQKRRERRVNNTDDKSPRTLDKKPLVGQSRCRSSPKNEKSLWLERIYGQHGFALP